MFSQFLKSPSAKRWLPCASLTLGSVLITLSAQPNVSLLDDQKHRTYSTRGGLRDFHRFYREEEKLGEGTFAIVKRGIDLSTKEHVAIKAIDKSKSDEECRANEVVVMEKLGRHPNLIGLHNVYESEDFLFIVQDIAEGGELFDRIIKSGELSEHEAARLFRDAVQAVDHLHSRKIAHLDIKPENLLLRLVPHTTSKNGTTKSSSSTKTEKVKSSATTKTKSALLRGDVDEIVALADFGLAVQSDEQFDLCVGTPAYWSPEMVKREKFGFPADMWALGCVLYILLCGMHPFDPTGDAPEAQILARVATGQYDKSSKEYKSLSEGAKDLIRHLLDVDPARRYTAKKALEHPWLTTEIASQEAMKSDTVSKLSGFRVLTMIKTGMRDMLHQAEKDLFDGLDVNGDGFLSKEELTKGLALVGFELSDAEIDAFLKLADADGDAMISRKEFSDMLQQRFDTETMQPGQDHARLEDLATLFKAYDKDDDGYISADDVHHVLTLLGSSVTKSVVQSEWAGVVDQDGLVSFAQFVKHVRQIEQEKKVKDAEGIAGRSSVLRLRDKRDLLHSRR